MRFLLLLISATVAFGTVSGQSTSTCGPVKPSPVANCDKVDYGSCGNACCTVDVSVADKPTDAYAKIKKYLEMGGSDGSFSYSAGPNRAGLNPGDDLTPYNISWKYIFQGSHVTTKGYVDHINMNIKVDGTTVDPSATTGHNAQCNTDPNNACGNELPQKECLAAGCCWEEAADWACWHPAPTPPGTTIIRLNNIPLIHGALGDNGQSYKSLHFMMNDIYPGSQLSIVHGCGVGVVPPVF